MVFWDYCAENRSSITNLTNKDVFQLRGNTSHYATFGEEGDISKICQFGWYQWIYFWGASAAFTFPSHVLGHCLGPDNNEINEMAQWVIKSNVQIVPQRTMHKLTADELVLESEVKKRADFTEAIKQQCGDSISITVSIRLNPKDDDETYDLPFDEVAPKVPELDIVDDEGTPIHPTFMADILINAEVFITQGEDLRLAKVILRYVDQDGEVIVNHNDILVLSNFMYNVEFPDGAEKLYLSNIISDNILNQVDADGYHQQSIDSILEH